MLWTVVLGEHASDHIFIDVESERFVDLLSGSWATKSGTTSFQFNNDPNKIIRGAFQVRFCVFSVMRITGCSCCFVERGET